jgi:hypothetical protein
MTGRIPSAETKAWICTADDCFNVQPQLQQTQCCRHTRSLIIMMLGLFAKLVKVLVCVQQVFVCKVILTVCKQKVFVCTVILSTCKQTLLVCKQRFRVGLLIL